MPNELVGGAMLGAVLALGVGAVYGLRRRVVELERARDVAIRHLENRDPLGAHIALTMQRDAPDWFRLATFDGDPPRRDEAAELGVRPPPPPPRPSPPATPHRSA